MKRSTNRKRHRPEEVVAKLRQADEALAKDTALAGPRLLVEQCRLHYNHRRVERALSKLAPAAFAASCLALPPLRLASLTCAAAPLSIEGVPAMRQLSQGVDR
jgi:hypothetical protein